MVSIDGWSWKAKRFGDSRAVAMQGKRALKAKLSLGDIGVFDGAEPPMPTFGEYADQARRRERAD